VTDSIAYLPQRGLPGIQPLDEALESAPLPLIVERRARSDRRGQREMREEWLPFTVEVVRDVDLLFREVFPERGLIPLRHAANIAQPCT
jgi:hypothetical protein